MELNVVDLTSFVKTFLKHVKHKREEKTNDVGLVWYLFKSYINEKHICDDDFDSFPGFLNHEENNTMRLVPF